MWWNLRLNLGAYELPRKVNEILRFFSLKDHKSLFLSRASQFREEQIRDVWGY